MLSVVANMIMEDIERRTLATFHTSHQFWKGYVDDACNALSHDLVEPFHKHLNSIDPNIQFTVERESGGLLPFLDVLMTREKDDTQYRCVPEGHTHGPVLGL